jgi:DNA-directed RNA polymerase subunit F
VGGTVEQRLIEQIVDVPPPGGEELRVFFAQNPVAENASSHA